MDPVNLSSPVPLKGAADSADRMKEQKLRQACADFEAIMLRQMLAAMRKTIPQGGLLDTGHAGRMYQSMQDEQLAQTLSQGQGIGLGEALYRQLATQILPGGRK